MQYLVERAVDIRSRETDQQNRERFDRELEQLHQGNSAPAKASARDAARDRSEKTPWDRHDR